MNSYEYTIQIFSIVNCTYTLNLLQIIFKRNTQMKPGDVQTPTNSYEWNCKMQCKQIVIHMR